MRKLILLVASLVLGLSVLPISFAITNGIMSSPFCFYRPPTTYCTTQCCLSFNGVTTSDNENTFTEPKDVGHTSACVSPDGKTLKITVNNAYPLYAGTVNFCVKNCGTLPADITAVNINNPNPTFVHLTLTGQVAAGITVPVGGSKCGQLVINGTPQIPQAQNRSFTFTIGINYKCVVQTCGTGYAYGNSKAICFLSPTIQALIHTENWGWTNGPLPLNYSAVWPIYVGAGQCNLANGKQVGTVTVSYYRNGTGYKVTLTFNMISGYTLTGTQVYAGTEKLPRYGGSYTVSPGQFPQKHTLTNATTDTFTFTVPGCTGGNIYIVAHADVCWFE